jgi:hypothetical protein
MRSFQRAEGRSEYRIGVSTSRVADIECVAVGYGVLDHVWLVGGGTPFVYRELKTGNQKGQPVRRAWNLTWLEAGVGRRWMYTINPFELLCRAHLITFVHHRATLLFLPHFFFLHRSVCTLYADTRGLAYEFIVSPITRWSLVESIKSLV